MVAISVMVRDSGTCIMQKISELEVKSERKLSIMKKILLAETGNVEQILSILTGAETIVTVLKQTECREVIRREVNIISKSNRKILVRATSLFFLRNLPKVFVNKVRQREKGIGNILVDIQLETFRKIIKIGYDSNSDTVFKVYQILYRGRVAIEIKEYFQSK